MKMTCSSHLTCKLKTYFNFLWIEKDKTRAMIYEAIVNTFMSPLLLTTLFFTITKCAGSFVELFNQVMKLGLEYGNKTHLQQSQM
jgi:hypothetical protein